MWKMPVLVDMTPPTVLGAAYLTTRAFQGEDMERLATRVSRHPTLAARLHDAALMERLCFRPERADEFQAQALALSPVFRVVGRADGRLRVLAVMLPGDMMVNTPLDFMLGEADVRLDLFYYQPGQPLPATLPDHDIAVFAAADSTPSVCAQLQAVFDAWPRPAINAPRWVPGLERDALSAALAGIDSICSPPAQRVRRAALSAALDFGAGAHLVRPAGTHAGHGLARIATQAELAAYLAEATADIYYVTRFVDYRSADGFYRKYRIAFIDRAPFLCHMAVSEHWMIHYLNAGMTESAAKRAEEAAAMAQFRTGFARRHAAAFDALNDVIGLDYHSIDCGEMADGRLLVFEADNAAIIHMMDPPELFPYKRPQMQRVFAAFYAMLERRCNRPRQPIENRSLSYLADAPA
jgi:hypothetical protein